MLTFAALAAGLILLFLGGDALVRGAAAVATRYGVSPMIVGLTIVGFGTSTPELLVSLSAAFDNQPGLAIGNVIGSNIANILLIGGIAALITPMTAPVSGIRFDLFWMIGVTLSLPLILWSGTIGLPEGAALLTALALYLFLSLRGASTPPDDALPGALPLWQAVLLAVAGLGAVLLGAQLLVDSASTIARRFGVSEEMIGLSIVAIGTSLPELATSAVAAWRGQREIALGNIIGSNIFNILAILGITATIIEIPAAPRFLAVDTPVAIATALFMAALFLWRGQIGRLAGLAMLLGYAIYIVTTVNL